MMDAFAWMRRSSALFLVGVCLPVAVAGAQAAPAQDAAVSSIGTAKTGSGTAGSAKTWSYDAVSVKPDKSGSNGMRMMTHGDVFTGENIRVIDLVSMAYGIKPDLISGEPGWTDGARFDVEAKMSPEDAEVFNKLGREERNAANRILLQGMLDERFHLKAHVETKQLPVYDLVIAKGGLKMKAATEGDTYPNGFKGPDGKGGSGMMHMQDGMLTVQGIEISGLINQLAFMVHRTVIDKTGIKGKYDFTLKYAPDHDGPLGADNGTPADDAPSLFAAIEEQLGLKLQPDKGPVDTLIIDHVEQPTEN